MKFIIVFILVSLLILLYGIYTIIKENLIGIPITIGGLLSLIVGIVAYFSARK